METRKDILLKAAYDFLSELEDEGDYYTLSTSVLYDGVECDGLCLKQDIAAELGINES